MCMDTLGTCVSWNIIVVVMTYRVGLVLCEHCQHGECWSSVVGSCRDTVSSQREFDSSYQKEVQ
jgi:hypothetical protein